MERAGQEACAPCLEPVVGVDALRVALIVILAVVLIYFVVRAGGRLCGREGFASRQAQEVYDRSRSLFERTQGNATYSDYKAEVPGADAVSFTDVRTLWKSGSLTPERVEHVL